MANSYFVAAVSALAEHPARIQRLFVDELKNELGIYGVNMTKNGVKVHVVVDNFIPVQKNRRITKPAFNRSYSNQEWVHILSKVWAKIHGSYLAVTKGECHHAFRDLTGAPSFKVKNLDDPE